jgi:hypothetical protein
LIVCLTSDSLAKTEKSQSRISVMLVFEKDVYPAFTAGDISKIHSALELVINQVNQ